MKFKTNSTFSFILISDAAVCRGSKSDLKIVMRKEKKNPEAI